MLTPEGARPGRVLSRYASVRTVSQVQLRLEREKGDAFKAVQREVLEWISRKAGKALPADAWDGRSFELDEIGAQRVAAAHLEEPRYWAARVDDADREVAQRTWITEIGLALAPEGGVLFGSRLIVSTRGQNPRFQPSIPVFVRQVIQGGKALLDGRALTRDPWLVRTKEDVNQLYRLLIAKGRRTDICAFSLDEDVEDPATALALASAVHRKTMGAAHVVIITGPAAFLLTDLVGKEFSVYNRAVRTFRPGFDTELDEPFRHPRALADAIADWQDDGIEGADAFENFLVRSLILQTVSGADLERILPPFSEARRFASAINLESVRDAGASQEQMLQLYEADNTKLRMALNEEKALHDGLLAEADRDRDDAQRRAEESKGEVYRLNQRIRTLETHLQTTGGAEAAIPGDLSDFKSWADMHLAGSIVITNRALRGAKESDYEEPSLVYRALLMLRDDYVPMRRRDGSAKRYADALLALGLEDSRSITPTRLGEQGDEYLVQHNGRRRELERHLKKGNSYESRHCFRLYFFWDEEDEQVVVGWLTSHLGTRQT
jgi:hypothetical protein